MKRPRGRRKRPLSLTAIAGVVLTVATVVLFLRDHSIPSDPDGEEESMETWEQAAMIDSVGEDDRRQNALNKGSRAKGRGRRGKGWTAARSNPKAGKGPGPGVDGEEQEEEEEEEEEFDMGERDPSLWQRCPSDSSGGNTSSMPTLEGLSLKLSKGMTWEDVFITQANHERLLRKEFAIAPSSVSRLPSSAEQIVTNYPWRSCAAVGNSGGLKFAEFGDVINSHDLVLRGNQAPTFGYTHKVGSKTTFRILNKSWTAKYVQGKFKAMGLPMERSVTLVLTRSTGKEFDRLAHYLKGYRADVAVLYLSSRVVTLVRRLLLAYRVRLCRSGRGPYDGGLVPSSGLVGVLIYLQMCKHVTVYGYGHDHPPKAKGSVPYHYFTGFGARQHGVPVHSWHTEELLLHQLAREGHVTFCRPDFRAAETGDPEALSHNRACGLNPELDEGQRRRWMQRHPPTMQDNSTSQPRASDEQPLKWQRQRRRLVER